MTTAKYQIRDSKHVELFTVRARDYQHAAEIAARKLYGRGGNLTALRVTGQHFSGFFQAYKSVRDGGQTSVGSVFHVS